MCCNVQICCISSAMTSLANQHIATTQALSTGQNAPRSSSDVEEVEGASNKLVEQESENENKGVKSINTSMQLGENEVEGNNMRLSMGVEGGNDDDTEALACSRMKTKQGTVSAYYQAEEKWQTMVGQT